MRNRRGSISVIELVVIPIVILECIYLLYLGFSWYHVHVSNGNDALKLNTCESIAKVNSLDGIQCPVNACTSENCTHRYGDGYIGYYDNVSNKIVGYKPSGYNESTKITIKDKTYTGDRFTMVIEVKVVHGKLQYRWVKGGN